MDEAINNRYDLQIAKQEIEVAQKNLKVIASQRVPDLAVLGGFAFQGAKHTVDNRFNGGAYVGASLINIPLFYNYGPEIKNAALKLQQAEMNYDSLKNKAEKDVMAAYEKFLISAQNLNDYESKIIPTSDELIDISIKSYEKGKSDLTALIVMKQSYKSILVGYTYALADYYNSWTNFLREVNDENFKL
jgi:cobalt-zinc-cadmium efflux system outer membrane protein